MDSNASANLTPFLTRRRWLTGLGAVGLSTIAVSRGAIADELKALPDAKPVKPPFDPTAPYVTLPSLGYDYSALAPFIDEKTMKIHHDLHHGAYVKNLNLALDQYPKYKERPIEELFRILNKIPEDIRATVRNSGGGHYNHSLFWDSMGPNGGGDPTGKLADAIVKDFGSFADFKTQFQDAGMKRFGSGWVWLAITRRGNLAISSTPNQDNPCMASDKPILGNDLWEHAYYLTYQNRRAEYLNQWWNVVNWTAVGDRYTNAIA